MAKELDPHQIQLQHVETYYNKAQRFYEFFWDKLGLHYGLWTEGVKNRKEAIQNENEVLANLAGIKEGDLVLDAGCGVAGSGIWLAKNRKAEVIELNIVRKQLNKGIRLAEKNTVRNNLIFTQADYQRVPYKDQCIDVVWSLESIEHSDDTAGLINEFYRVLKPGGRIVVTGTFKGSNEASKKQKEQMDIGMRAAGAFNDFRSAEEMGRLMNDVGFGKIQNQNVTNLVMRSAKEMELMCRLGLPGARLAHAIRLVSQEMLDNTAWGTYQAGLFRKNVTEYNILSAVKPTG